MGKKIWKVIKYPFDASWRGAKAVGRGFKKDPAGTLGNLASGNFIDPIKSGFQEGKDAVGNVSENENKVWGVAQAGANYWSQNRNNNYKINGIPTPGYKNVSPAQSGQDEKTRMDNAFPGTTAWERLGTANAQGNIQVAKNNKIADMELQERQLAVQERMNTLNARTGVIIATTPLGANARKQALEAQAGRSTEDWDSQTKINREEINAKIPNIQADTQVKLEQKINVYMQALKTKNEVRINKIEAELAEVLKENDISNSDKTMLFLTMARKISKYAQARLKNLLNIKDSYGLNGPTSGMRAQKQKWLKQAESYPKR